MAFRDETQFFKIKAKVHEMGLGELTKTYHDERARFPGGYFAGKLEPLANLKFAEDEPSAKREVAILMGYKRHLSGHPKRGGAGGGYAGTPG